jgi:predicted PurR-regulated permease PerM
MITPYIIGFVIGFFAGLFLALFGIAAERNQNEIQNRENYKREMARIANLADRMMAANKREQAYINDLRDIRGSLKTIAVELQKRIGWTH